MSWKAEFEVSGSWSTNAVRLATKVEGEKYANDLFCRWTQPTGFRVVESDDDVNYAWGPSGLEPVEVDEGTDYPTGEYSKQEQDEYEADRKLDEMRDDKLTEPQEA